MGDAGKPSVDFSAIWKRVTENRDKRDACPRHHFRPLPLENIRLGAKVTCLRCGGEMDMIALGFYVRGYEAHGGNGNDILPGWKANEDGTPQRRHFGQPED